MRFLEGERNQVLGRAIARGKTPKGLPTSILSFS